MFFRGERKGRGQEFGPLGVSLNIALSKALLTLGTWMVLSIPLPPALLSCHTKGQQQALLSSQGTLPKKPGCDGAPSASEAEKL